MIAQNSIVHNKWAKDPRCVLLMHMNGENDGTVFLDDSPSPKTATSYGGACTKTSIKRIGNASAFFDGTDDVIIIPDNADFHFSNNNFTVSCWVKRSTTQSAPQQLICQSDTSAANTSFSLSFTAGNYPTTWVHSSSTLYQATSSTVITDTNWHHLSAIRNGTILYLYVDGIAAGSVSVGSISVNNSTSSMGIGRYGGYDGYRFPGYIDELAIWNGIAIPIADLYPARAPLYDYAISEWSGQ